jgi:dipeptidyl aminopeptidase/acylaminoacyl peptidase
VSPLYYLKKSSAPLLHIHGDQDPVISLTQAKHLEQEAKKRGAPVTVMYVKGGGHGWASKGIDPDRNTINQRSLDFILREITH